MRPAASGPVDAPDSDREPPPADPADYLRWFIDTEAPADGTGPHGLADYCHQIRTYGEARHASNVHLFHYADMWVDLGGEMRPEQFFRAGGTRD